MLEAIAFGMDESALAYDMQRAHSADVWFLRARFYFWGFIASLVSFCIGHALPSFGVNLFSTLWGGITSIFHF
tara:strand:+ start:48 stop:266 length:219 start_codon:yes stop_codon:yes gene_type:complete